MALVAVKCTQCGADLQVDKEKEAAVCEHCGSAFIVEKAINNYNIANAQTVNIQVGNDIHGIQNSREKAEKSLLLGQYKNAYIDFCKAIEFDATDSKAYWGLILLYMIENPHLPIVRGYSSDEIVDVYNSAIAYADESEANLYKETVENHNEDLLEQIRIIDIEREKEREKEKKTTPEKIAAMILGITITIVGISMAITSIESSFLSNLVFDVFIIILGIFIAISPLLKKT